jgi:hypothetical protein
MAKIVRWDNGETIYKDNSPFIEETIQNALLQKIDLSYANLRGVNFYKKWNLNNINFSNADFKNARVYRADFSGAILNNVKNLNTNCPKEGEFIGYKKCFVGNLQNIRRCIVKLKILSDSRRSSSTTKKCRCDKVLVLEIQNLNGSRSRCKTAKSCYDISFKYKIGEVVEVKNFDDRFWVECAPGIHFFMNRDDAVKY